jgi:hypothetical protein
MTIDISDEVKEPSPAVAAVRAELMNGLATVDVFAEAIGKTHRQIQNYVRAGMPHVRYGKTPHICITEAKHWLLAKSNID